MRTHKTLLALIIGSSLSGMALAGPAMDCPNQDRAADCPYHNAMGQGQMMPMHGMMAGHGQMMPYHGMMMGQQHGYSMRGLDLSEQQIEALHAAAGKEEQARKDLDKKYLSRLPDADKQAMRKELKQLRHQHWMATQKILTPEQQAQYKRNKQESRQMHEDWEEFQAFRRWKAQQMHKPAAHQPGQPMMQMEPMKGPQQADSKPPMPMGEHKMPMPGHKAPEMAPEKEAPTE